MSRARHDSLVEREEGQRAKPQPYTKNYRQAAENYREWEK